MSLEESVNNDHWLAKAVYAAAAQHKGFSRHFMKANPGYKNARKKKKARAQIGMMRPGNKWSFLRILKKRD